MAGSVNMVILVGNLGMDPVVRTTLDGSKIVNLTLATARPGTTAPPASARSEPNGTGW